MSGLRGRRTCCSSAARHGGALALALIDVVITDKLDNEAFVRQWTNGSLLVRADNGVALTESDLTTDGSPQRFVAWDETPGTGCVRSFSGKF